MPPKSSTKSTAVPHAVGADRGARRPRAVDPVGHRACWRTRRARRRARCPSCRSRSCPRSPSWSRTCCWSLAFLPSLLAPNLPITAHLAFGAFFRLDPGSMTPGTIETVTAALAWRDSAGDAEVAGAGGLHERHDAGGRHDQARAHGDLLADGEHAPSFTRLGVGLVAGLDWDGLGHRSEHAPRPRGRSPRGRSRGRRPGCGSLSQHRELTGLVRGSGGVRPPRTSASRPASSAGRFVHLAEVLQLVVGAEQAEDRVLRLVRDALGRCARSPGRRCGRCTPRASTPRRTRGSRRTSCRPGRSRYWSGSSSMPPTFSGPSSVSM